jgi:UDP-N-acetylglucosamine acyltransferase
MKIHPTAIISPEAEIAEDVEIGAYSIIGPDVHIGKQTVLGPHVVIETHTDIGDRCGAPGSEIQG